jgi:phosphoglucomutase/phosphomannomutase
MTTVQIDPEVQKRVQVWLNGDYDDQTKEAIRKMAPEELIDAFYRDLEFGTGGLRGVMGVGTNRMNKYTVGAATQGLANYILKHREKGCDGVVIGYDSRHHSREYSELTAHILAANGIRVFIFAELRPTPLVSFACRYKHAQAAIMITASHNLRQYNGYKVYWSDGAQVLPPHDVGIINEVNAIRQPSQVRWGSKQDDSLISWMGPEVDEAYCDAIAPLAFYPEANQRFGGQLKPIYTSLHGTGITLAPKAMARWGFNQVAYVDKQVIPDGDFPTCPYPNPEEPDALKLGIETLMAKEGDLLLATDPDADRLGVVVRHQGKPVILNGNQIASICMHHICDALQKRGELKQSLGFIKTIVTTELIATIARAYGKSCTDVLTGFKYIGQIIHQWETTGGPRFVFGGEESYGYLLGTHARDKDAEVMCALLCEIALGAKQQGKTLVDRLDETYRRFGLFRERLESITLEGREGHEKILEMMKTLRHNPPSQLSGRPVVAIEDYSTSTRTEIPSGKTSRIDLPKSNVLRYWLDDQTKVVARPSGTEPKIKFYCGVQQPATDPIDTAIQRCDQQLDLLISDLKRHIGA